MLQNAIKRRPRSAWHVRRAPVGYIHHPEVNTARPRVDELLGTVAHELRSPLASSLTGLYLLTSECAMDPLVRQTLVGMEDQLQRAMRLVDDLFDICAGGLEKLSLRKEVVSVAELVARTAETARRL